MKILFVALLFFYSANLFSQQVISSSGATKTVKIGGGDFTVSWTIGEGVITTLSQPSKELTQGFHQPIMIELFPTSLEGDFDTGNMRYKARERYSFGYSNFRAVFGSQGA